MAKSRPTIGRPLRPGHEASEQAVRRAEEKLRERYRIGKEALAANTKGTPNDGPTIRRLADETGFSTSEIRRSRSLAAGYDEDEFEALLQLRIGGHPPLWDHVKDLIQVRSKSKRLALQKEAEKKSWSVRQLRNEIKVRRLDRSADDIARRAGGRRHAPVSSPPAALVKILDLAKRWTRFHKDSGVGGPDSPLKELSRVSRKGRQARLQQISEAESALVELRASISSVLEQIERSRKEIEKAERADRKTPETEIEEAGSAKKPRRRSRKAKSRPKSVNRKTTRKRPPK